MVKVIKRNGLEEEFIPEKVVISVLKTGAPVDVARKIAKIIEGRIYEKDLQVVEAKELTKWILELLRKSGEEWYRAWIVFDKYIKKRDTEKEMI
ncbi:MAG: ATPase [Sulfolobales archaeon]|nr:ATPase [Sulfolobales archaeon]MCX8186082.1 ATPase [Sulfolobales archaeon]MDW7969377.1 ATPase [Sulfolobales archaeon]